MGKRVVMFPTAGLALLLVWAVAVSTVVWILVLYGPETIPEQYDLYLRLSFAALPIGAMIGLMGFAQERGFRRFGFLGVLLNIVTFVFCFLPWQQWVG